MPNPSGRYSSPGRRFRSKRKRNDSRRGRSPQEREEKVVRKQKRKPLDEIEILDDEEIEDAG